MKVCERCKSTFDCAANEPSKKCWCVEMPQGIQIPKNFGDCLCPKCLKLFAQDFYMENGFTVFTPKFLLARGYCCNSGCRHCPY